MVLEWLSFVLGVFIVIGTGVSLLSTLVVPRRFKSRIPSLVDRIARAAFLFVSNLFDSYEPKDRVLTFQAPLTLLAVLIVWLVLFLFGYSLMLLPLIGASFADALRESGSSMFTLGFAGTEGLGPTIVHFLAAGTGLVAVALLIAYLPVLYAAFNRREALVTLLQSRAGAPAWGPEILARHHTVGLNGNLPALYAEWEAWAADVAETHPNYPILVNFRSPAPLRSWVVALLAVLDAAALQLSLTPATAPNEARLCIRMGFLCLRDIAAATAIPFDPDPLPTDPIELTFEDFVGGIHRLEEIGFPMEKTPDEAWPHFKGWRTNYESVAYVLADRVVAPPGPWSGPRTRLPGLEIIPQRPANRRPGEALEEAHPKGSGIGTG